MPPETSALGSAADWLTDLLSGPLAVSFAILAVAGIGFAMLNGHLPVRRAASVVFGCFLILGASSIANGLAGFSNLGASADMPSSFPPSLPVEARKIQTVADPYAGASLIRN